MEYFGHFYLDLEKDIIVDLYMEDQRMFYVLRTPNHHSGNLITNLAEICHLPLSFDESGLKVVRGEILCYINQYNQRMYIFRLGSTKVANIFPDGTIEMKASLPAVSKTLMSQTKDYTLDEQRTIIKSYILEDCKFRSDLHTHMNANLAPDILIALGIFHQIRYPLYYVKKLSLSLTEEQNRILTGQRNKVQKQFADSFLQGKYLTRRIDDNTFINFADLILNNLSDAAENITKIRCSLAILKDGQAVFTNLEKVYLYRYVFTKGLPHEKPVDLNGIENIPDEDIVRCIRQMMKDRKDPRYRHNTLFQNKLLWIARTYQKQGIRYVEISDTALVKRKESVEMLKAVHEVMPAIYEETGVRIRFLAGIRRIPLTIIKDQITAADYLNENLNVLKAVACDPYVAGSDIIGEEVNDILDLKPVIAEIVKIARENPGFTIRIHAGENDSLKDNVANSIHCVIDALKEGESCPPLRIGHGLYTPNLKSKKGEHLIRMIRENNVTLEFQITSNVRLNNLSILKNHPLKQYLQEGLLCVQGTDGAALYGTSPIDEQLALEKLLNLTPDHFRKMREAEERIISRNEEIFSQRMETFRKRNEDAESFYHQRMHTLTGSHVSVSLDKDRIDTGIELSGQIEELPWDRFPVILAGGSFNNDQRMTRTTEEGREFIRSLMEKLDPGKVFFVIGHTLKGYEKYLAEHNRRGFRIFSIIPSRLSEADIRRLKQSGLKVRISTESEPMGLYKSFNYEIFERRPSVLIALDGNSAGSNLIQEARNGKGKSRIFVNSACTPLRQKAETLQGYISLFRFDEYTAPIIDNIREICESDI